MPNYTKFFRNGKSFSAYCRARYGQSKEIWEDTTLWVKAVTLNEENEQTKNCSVYAIAFDKEAADSKFQIKNENIN